MSEPLTNALLFHTKVWEECISKTDMNLSTVYVSPLQRMQKQF